MRRLTILFLLGVSGLAHAASLPSYVKLPAGAEVVAGTLVDETYGQANMPVAEDMGMSIRMGRHVHFDLRLPGADDSTHEGIWAPFRNALTSAGWTVAKYYDVNPPLATLRYQKGGADSWLVLAMLAADDIRCDLIEVRPFKPTLVLRAPAATVEKVGLDADFPYLEPLGGRRMGTEPENGPLFVHLKGDEEPTMVAAASVRKDYNNVESISNLHFVEEYRAALKKAGWQIVHESQGISQSDAVVVAHYVKDPRDIWTYLHKGGEEMSFTVADVSGDLAASLEKNCKLPLYGVTFDFNKATIRPISEPTLQRVAAALQSKPAIDVEVQGHTDNVGGDESNLKLSQARAESVRKWLSGHGVAEGRMTAKGYGRRQPVADNDTEAGRAKNRRVEMIVAGCRK